MGEETLENSIMEKYLGDIIHEKGYEESITVTIQERIRKLTLKCEEIFQIANSSILSPSTLVLLVLLGGGGQNGKNMLTS